MNALQFKKLKIGDRILTYNGTCTTVTDIDRMAGKLTCGNGQWRDYHRVRMAVETDLLVEHMYRSALLFCLTVPDLFQHLRLWSSYQLRPSRT